MRARLRRPRPAPRDPQRLTDLRQIPNIGPAIASYLRQIGVDRPRDLAGRDPYEAYEQLCEAMGIRLDPCLLDVLISAVRFMDGAPPLPWWHYTAERKRALLERAGTGERGASARDGACG